MLTINTLGKFQVTNGSAVLDDEGLRSVMLSRLAMYIFLYRDKTLTTEDIIEAVWHEEEIDNPAGALKNLMYRLRKVLASTFGEAEYIISSRGSYHWNPDVEILLDIEQFETLINQAKQENNCNNAILMYESAVMLYQGDFMTTLMDLSWIMTLNTYYHSLFLSCVKALAELYVKTEKYEKLEKLCNDALKYENGDEQLYCYQIQARMRCGKIGLALESYDKAREIMERELGVRKTTILNKVYEELLTMSKGQNSYSISEVQRDIVEEEPEGVFLCGYPVFKEIYHLEARKCIRTNEEHNLVLFTISTVEPATREVEEYRIRQVMNALTEVIKESLRVGDVAAKYSDTQYIVLLLSCTRELALLVANRVISKLLDKNPAFRKVKIQTDIEKVSTNSRMVE